MKKTIAFVLLCAILSITVLGSAAAVIDPRKDDVMVRQTTLFGDPAAAEGLQIENNIRYEDHALWNVHFNVGETQTETNFSFSHTKVDDRLELDYKHYGGLTIDMFGGDHDDQFHEKAAIYRDLAKDAEDNVEISRIVCPADYYEMYPLFFEINYPDYPTYTRWQREDPVSQAVQDALRAAFPIPVDPDDLIEVHFEKRDNNNITSWGGSSYGSFPDLQVSSYCDDNGIYFTFFEQERGGITLDFSKFPEGYGVYFLPMLPADDENSDSTAQPDGLCNVYPLDETQIECAEVYGLDDRLFVITLEGEQYWATVLDMGTYEVLQRFKVCDDPEGWRIGNIFGQDDHLIINFYGDRIALIAPDGNEGYETALYAKLPDELYNYCSFSHWRVSSAWDGECLAIAADTDESELYVAVYDRTGLLYTGLYETSLTDQPEYQHRISPLPERFGGSSDPRYCLFTYNAPYQITWQQNGILCINEIGSCMSSSA